MNLIKHTNQRTVIHLSRQGDVFLARMIVLGLRFNGSYTSHVVGVQILSADQVEDLKLKAQALSAYGVLLVDATVEQDTFVALPFSVYSLNAATPVLESARLTRVVVSPYFSKISLQESFFASQLTRGPNTK
ncbi:MAG: hypothetical protein RL094_517 [Candidatus Parcubacteria bacterium]|jgi:hypothetical protein